jgi:DNA (cytosine-5)-methyltransferase 1
VQQHRSVLASPTRDADSELSAPVSSELEPMPDADLTCVEICAGAGGQALGLDKAGFRPLALIENDDACVQTLRAVKPPHVRHAWKNHVVQIDVRWFYAGDLPEEVDLFAGGVPCPPFSRGGRQLGADDERDLFPTAIKRIRECQPKAVMLENVRGLLHTKFDDYRRAVVEEPLLQDDYIPIGWRLLEAKNFGVPQLRPRVIFVAVKKQYAAHFAWPQPEEYSEPPTVGDALLPEMRRRGWKGAKAWAEQARGIAPTLVGGSKKHGGPDLGPTQARKQWAKLGVNGKLVALEPPDASANGEPPILTVRMAAILQGFPADWPFWGKKTAAYRQVGNAFPPPVAKAVGLKIAAAIRAGDGEASGGNRVSEWATEHSPAPGAPHPALAPVAD